MWIQLSMCIRLDKQLVQDEGSNTCCLQHIGFSLLVLSWHKCSQNCMVLVRWSFLDNSSRLGKSGTLEWEH